MADQRQPFRFRLPWLPPTQATTQPPTAPAPRMPAPAPAPAPPRPPFRPGGVAPTQPSPRANPPPPPPPPKAASPPKKEPPSKPVAPTSSPPKTDPASKPVSSTSSPPKTEPPSSSKTEPPTKPIASTTSPQKTEPPSSPKTEPPPKPMAPTSSPPKTSFPSPLASTSKEATATTSQAISPPKPPSPKSPSGSPARSKPASPSSSFPPSPRANASTEKLSSPKRELSPTMLGQDSSYKQELEKTQAQQQQATISSENASENGKLPHSLPESTQQAVTSTPGNEETKEVKMVIDESIKKRNGEPRKKEAAPECPESETVLQTMSRVGQRPTESTSHQKVNKLRNGKAEQFLDGEKKLTVVTLSGENRGASMTLTNESTKKESSIPIHRGYKANPNEKTSNSTDEEENSMAGEESKTKAYINSNVQGINNSLLFNGTVSTRNPGVRYVRFTKGRRQDQDWSFETNKAEFSGTQSEMLAYAPNVRRRCLRSLLMESSDSDQEKPRRHGCRYDCKDKNKDDNVNLV